MENKYDMSATSVLGSNPNDIDDFVAVMNDLNDDLLRTRLD